MNLARNPYDYYFYDNKGRPIFNGNIYIGLPGLDPEIPANQIDVYGRQEDGTDVLLAQPIATNSGGGATLNGSPIILMMEENFYSLKVLDSLGVQAYYSENTPATLTSELLSDLITVVENVAALASTPVAAGRTYYLKEYNAGTGKGGRELVGVAGSTTYDDVITFEGDGGYFESINIKDRAVEYAGVVYDGTTDDTEALQRAADAKFYQIPEGTIVITAPIETTSDFIFEGCGDASIIDASAVTGAAFKADGAIAALPDISNVSAGAYAVVFASTHGLVAGDVFIIYNPTNSSYSGFRTNYRAGEFCEVKSVVGLTVNLKSPLYAGYTGAAVDIYKLTSGVVSIKNLKIIGSDSPIELTKIKNPLVQNVTVESASNSSIYFNKCWMPLADNCTVDNIGASTDDYGIVFGNCQHGKVTKSNVYARRHTIATGGDAEIGCVPCRDIRISGSVLRNDFDSGTHCADFHGNTEDSSYEGCTIYGGVSWQGKNNHFRSCTIYAMDGGMVQYAAEILGGEFSLFDCDLISKEDPSAVTRGLIDVGGNTSVLTSSTTSTCTFSVKDCRINGENFSNITSLMYVRVTGSTVPVNIEFNDNKIKVNDLGQAVLASVNSGSTSPDYVIVDNLAGLASGKILANLASGFLTAPMRMQSCSGVIASATTTSSPGAQETATFKYVYPKAPVVHVTKSTRNYNGNRVGIAIADTATTSNSILGLYTDDGTNFSAAQSFNFNWTAGINEL